ncbi:MAG: FAD-dependent thymidylate synthase [Candidatus Micrarchaeota archaeon]|nr:FAD-dependent thymidylate synthase [Candidatus Micrarchaeota archaeon]
MSSKTLLKFSESHSGIPVEEFTEQEAEILNRYVTTTDGNIFAWRLGDNFTPEQSGALLSRYSRTSFTSKQLFLKEFYPNKDRGREFFEAWLVSYGDDSIQEMAGGLPMSFEFVSNVMAKEIENGRIGSYIEKSTRYVPFDKRMSDGEYMFYRGPEITESRFGDDYLGLMRELFGSYERNLPGMIKYISDLNPIADQTFRIGDRVVRISDLNSEIEERYGIAEKDITRAYENASKANAYDLLRDYLPMSTLTHIGASMNARSYESLILRLRSLESKEAEWIAKCVYTELRKLAPSLIKRAYERHGNEFSDFMKSRRGEARRLSASAIGGEKADNRLDVQLDQFTGRGAPDPDTEAQVALSSVIMYDFASGQSMEQLERVARSMTEADRKRLIAAYVGNRTNRRHKPGRAFENIEYQFDLMGRIGIYRDIQRHRMGTQERQDFTVRLGYNTRSEYSSVGISEDYKGLMGRVIELHDKMHGTMPYQAQYVVTFGFNTRWYYRMNARQAFHLCELRTTPGGHPDYRRLVQNMYYRIRDAHPTVAGHMGFVDLNDRPLGRLESEVRIAEKKKALEKR